MVYFLLWIIHNWSDITSNYFVIDIRSMGNIMVALLCLSVVNISVMSNLKQALQSNSFCPEI